MRKRITYRPGKAAGVFGGLVGLIFVLVGLFIAIPIFGVFGVLWTLIAVGITGMNLYHAFGRRYAGPEISIEEDGEADRSPAASGEPDAKERLEQLESLRSAGLITQEEYREKREHILNSL